MWNFVSSHMPTFLRVQIFVRSISSGVSVEAPCRDSCPTLTDLEVRSASLTKSNSYNCVIYLFFYILTNYITLLTKLLFLSLNFCPKLWKIRFSSLNFQKVRFYIWILSFKKKKSSKMKFIYKNEFLKIEGRKTNFMPNLKTKTII